MANAEQLKALFKSHFEGDEDRFCSVAMRIAANEARRGHGKLATELRELIDDAKCHRSTHSVVSINRPQGELETILDASYSKTRLGEMVLEKELSEQIQHVIREQRHAARIREHGLVPRRKLLLAGHPGTGMTMTASVLAGELGIPLFQVRLDGLVTKFMGGTASKLRLVFDAASRTRGVYLFDKFDAIGSMPSTENNVGEVRRVLNSFIQMIEQDQSQSLILAATNRFIDIEPALFRRFDDVLLYILPDRSQIAKLLKTRLSGSCRKGVRWGHLAKIADGMNHADIVQAANEVLKDALFRELDCVGEPDIRAMLEERMSTTDRLFQNIVNIKRANLSALLADQAIDKKG